MKDLFRQLDDVPFWVDRDQLDLGGRTFLRSGVFGLLVLMGFSLPMAYSSPAGNKPLVFSGRLVHRAIRRLNETGKFLLSSCQPGSLQRFSPGFKITVKVRFMHAQVRRLLLQSGRWNSAAWGMPISQCHMAGTNLLFSVAVLDGLRRLGFHFTYREVEGLILLWRYSGYLIGIDPELLCGTEAEVRRLGELIHQAEGLPDQDSQELVWALMATAKDYGERLQLKKVAWLLPLCYGLSHWLIGGRRAAELSYPKTFWRLAFPLLHPVISGVEFLRRLIPGGNKLAVAAGARTLTYLLLELDPAAKKAAYSMPDRLTTPSASSPPAGRDYS